VGQLTGRAVRLLPPLRGICGRPSRVSALPYADVGPIRISESFSDEQVLFLSDIFPTGYMAAEYCNLKGGETVAIWGCGPVGQFAIRSALLLGAGRILAIDTVPERLALARNAGAETIDFLEEDVYDGLMELTKGRGADACIDAVGTEAEPSASLASRWDRINARSTASI
jgi:threonine dehydrogenase-like Zn-dependent dehydrogenase